MQKRASWANLGGWVPSPGKSKCKDPRLGGNKQTKQKASHSWHLLSGSTRLEMKSELGEVLEGWLQGRGFC